MESAADLDAIDELRVFRERFTHSDSEPDLIYLDGNSLGRQPVEAKKVLELVVGAQWGERLIRGWNEGWLDIPLRVGNLIGELIGAAEGEVILAENTSVCLFKLAVAKLKAQPSRTTIITTSDNFPSDIQVLHSAALNAGLRHIVRVIDTELSDDPMAALCEALDDSTALVSLSHVSYRSGWRWDLAEVNQAATKTGSSVLWDFSHSVGAIPIDVAASKVEVAVGCTYKYLNGGPGAPAFMYVRSDQNDLINPISGWFGSQDPFTFDPSSPAASDITRFLTGTPHVVSAALIQPGVEMLLDAGIDSVYRKSVQLSDRFIQLCDEQLGSLGFEVRSPISHVNRGSHVALFHPDAQAVGLALINEASIIPDFRPPDILRFGFAPLYTRFADVDATVDRIRELVMGGAIQRWQDKNPIVP